MNFKVRRLTNSFFIALSFATATLSDAIAETSPTPLITELNRIVAVVNDDVILENDLQTRISRTLAEQRQQGRVPYTSAELTQRVLKQMVLEQLQLQVAKRTRLRVEDDKLNRMLMGIAGKNRLSPERFRETLEVKGYSFTTFRENLRRKLLIAEVQKHQVANRVEVSEQEIEHHLAQQDRDNLNEREYHLAHILIAARESMSPEDLNAAREKTKRLLLRLREGEDFAQAAMRTSHGQQALKGGDLGWRKEMKLPSIFAAIVPKMAPGQITDPIQSASGFHLVKLIAHRDKQMPLIPQIHARHILIHTSETLSDEDAKTRLEQLLERIRNGEEFEELARFHSQDRGSAVKGGDLGWINPGSMVLRFERVISRLDPGEISAPFHTRFGWHIAQVLAHRKHDGTDAVRRTRAIEAIRTRKIDEALQDWLRQLRDEAYIEYHLKHDTGN